MQSNYDKGLNRPDHSFKFKLMGDAGVGKSGLLLRLINNTFAEAFISTIGSDFLVKNIPINGDVCELKIFDTAGYERLKKPTSNYTPSTNVYMICFDVSNPETFNNVQKWREMINEVDSDAIKIVVATKCDLIRERKVPLHTMI
jgi:small GTP-binding protein